jgi:hypothetical protein
VIGDWLLPDQVQDDLTAMSMDSVFKEIYALPGTKNWSAFYYGDRELHLSESRLQMCGHIVEALVVVLVRPVVRRKAVEVGTDIALHGRIGILLNEKRS